jgi:hypothetical protein
VLLSDDVILFTTVVLISTVAWGSIPSVGASSNHQTDIALPGLIVWKERNCVHRSASESEIQTEMAAMGPLVGGGGEAGLSGFNFKQ